jgi:4-azaleucine resistance transporter AzlC
MTALFVVIFIEQWLAEKKHAPAITGVLSAVLSIQIFGASQMVLPSMVIMFLTLIAIRKKVTGGDAVG